MAERAAKIEKIAGLLYSNVVLPDRARIQRTGSILPTTSLRHKSTRDMLGWTTELKDNFRYFTTPLVKDVLLRVVEKFAVELPQTPGFSLEGWATDQASILAPILKRSRRSTAQASVPDEAMGDADNADTQAWDCSLDPTQDLCKSRESSLLKLHIVLLRLKSSCAIARIRKC